MSIERMGDTFDLICDICGNEAEQSFFEFQEAVSYKKREGWKSQKRKGEWEDVCPECQEG